MVISLKGVKGPALSFDPIKLMVKGFVRGKRKSRSLKPASFYFLIQ
jgi:hypothetical protein